MATRSTLATTAKYVASIGLLWTEKLDDVFQREIRPGIDTQIANSTWKVGVGQAQRMGLLPTYTDGYERAFKFLVRRHKAFEYIAIGIPVLQGQDGNPTVLKPELWEDLKPDAEENALFLSGILVKNIKVADAAHLWPEQREVIRRSILRASVERPPRSEEPERQDKKSARVEEWFLALPSKPRTKSAAMRMARTHFEGDLNKNQISVETIRLFLSKEYPKEKGSSPQNCL